MFGLLVVKFIIINYLVEMMGFPFGPGCSLPHTLQIQF